MLSKINIEFSKLKSQWKLIPNLLSMLRVVLIIPISFLYPYEDKFWEYSLYALIIIAFISDGLDGWVARRFNMKSELGLILDPVSDKLWTFVLTILVMLYRGLPVWLGMFIIFRDLVILGMNAISLLRGGKLFASNIYGKISLFCIGFMIIGYTIRLDFSYLFGYVVVALTPIVLVTYFNRIRQPSK